MAGNEDVEKLEYEGNIFYIRTGRSWYRYSETVEIQKIEVQNEDGKVICPSRNAKGIEISEIYFTEQDSIKEIYIPETYSAIHIKNKDVGNLEKIEVAAGNKNFSADENSHMLLSKDRKRLILALVEGNRDKAVVPAYIEKIGSRAFEGCTCKEIQFDNPGVKIESDSFAESVWFTSGVEYRLIGSTFAANLKETEKLVVPQNVKRFDVAAFHGTNKTSKVNHIVTPVIPGGEAGEHLGYYCEKITLTSKRARISRTTLENYKYLKALEISDEHRFYTSIDGVVFSKDRKKLIYYPLGKTDTEYQVPDFVESISPRVFSENRYLKKVVIPNSVRTIGAGAFFQCKKLQEVILSKNLREIPDAGMYRVGGVFEDCQSLKSIQIPKSIEYIGRKAFLNSGLQKVEFESNSCLKHISEYAFAETMLSEITLPESLERLGNGAIREVEKVTAYEGTAKGLISAVCAHPAYANQNKNLMEWVGFDIHVKRKKHQDAFLLYIPKAIKKTEVYHLEIMWNGDTVDLAEYDECFPMISDAEEKLKIAKMRIASVLKECQDAEEQEENLYFQYMKRASLKVAEEMLKDGAEEEFLAFLDQGFLSDASKTKLLKLANKKNMTTISAYILQNQEKERNGKAKRPGARFSL